MWGAIKTFGNWLRSIQGFVWIASLMPAVATYLAGWLEEVPAAVQIASITGALAAGVLIVYFGLLVFDRLFPAARPVPLLEIWRQAEKYGWDFKADPNLHVLDFVLALQQSGLDGDLRFRGRSATSTIESFIRNEPINTIDAGYWGNHQVEWSRICYGENGTIGNFIDDNYYCFSYDPKNAQNLSHDRYYDLHVSGATAKWFKKIASTFIGRNVKQKESRNRQGAERNSRGG